MAEKALKKIEDQLNCSICLDTYTDPKQLQCFHVYCRQCLVKLVFRDEQKQLVLTCPTCRQVTPIPEKGVSGLQPAFHINQLLEIVGTTHRKEGNGATKVESDSASGDTDVRNVTTLFCSSHAGKELELYCETCGEIVCFHCTLQNNKHHGHNCGLLNEAYEKYKEEIRLSLEPMETKMAENNSMLPLFDTCRSEITEQQAAIRADICTTMAELRKVLVETLAAREADLMTQLDSLTTMKLRDLTAQKDRIETIQTQLGSCLEFMKESLKTGDQVDVLVLRMKETIAKQVKELTTPVIAKPSTQASIMFVPHPDLKKQCQSFGKLFSLNQAVTIKGSSEAVVRAKSSVTVTISAISSDGKSCDPLIESCLECSLWSEIKCNMVKCSVQRRTSGQFIVTYTPTIKGRHQLHIKISGQDVSGSPLSVSVRSPTSSGYTYPIRIISSLSDPWAVAINQEGKIVVSEQSKNCVTVCSLMGEKLLSFGSCGSGEGEFKSPSGVAVDGEGIILVADSGNNRIQKFTAEGRFVGMSPSQFNRPFAVAYNATNRKLYVTHQSNHVQVLNSDLTFSSKFGIMGQCQSPQSIDFDSIGNVYVADGGNCRIHVFSADGRFLKTLGNSWQGLKWPIGVALDKTNRYMMYVSEYRNSCIFTYNSETQLSTSFGKRGKGATEFFSPAGLAVDASGVLYVCDRGNNRVLLY